MKKFFDGFKAGIGFFVAFVLLLIISIYAVKARSGLTATPGDKLTASNWNALVSNLSGVQTQLNTLQTKTLWVDVATTDTNPFDRNCERRFYVGTSPFYIVSIRSNGTDAFRPWPGSGQSYEWFRIKATEKNNLYKRHWTSTGGDIALNGTITKLQKKCPN